MMTPTPTQHDALHRLRTRSYFMAREAHDPLLTHARECGDARALALAEAARNALASLHEYAVQRLDAADPEERS